MDSIVPENVRILLEQKTFILDTNNASIDNLTCIMCKKLMKDAYQSYCECTYCYECIAGHLSDGPRYCDGKNKYCRNQLLILNKNVVRSAMLNNKILNLKVICPNLPCAHASELIKMDDHLRICTKQPMECPYGHIGCNDGGLSRDTLKSHIDADIVSHTNLLMEWIDQFKNEFNASKLEILSLQEESNSNKMKINTLEQAAVDKEAKIVALEKELADNKTKLLALEKELRDSKDQLKTSNHEMKKNEEKVVSKEKHDEESVLRIKAVEEELKDTYKKVEILETNYKSRDERLADLEEKAKNHELSIETMHSESTRKTNRIVAFEKELKKKEERLSKLEIKMLVNDPDSMNDMTLRIDNLSHSINALDIGTNAIVATGIMSFTIEEMDANKATKEVLSSPYFYSHANGYKCRLLVYPGGTGDGADTHLSLYLVICSGEYDEILPWPCQSIFTLSITNQLSREAQNAQTLSYDTCADNLKFAYKKPITDENDGCGFPTFISHESLRDTDFLVVNDSVIIECVVTPKK